MTQRPDLGEFLGALTGFLDKKSDEPHDPSYLRFLEIFCRSVGSAEGHVLKYKEGVGLQSIVSFGLPAVFEKEFNDALATPNREPIPLDAAFKDQQVVALVEIKRGTGIPFWFMDVMNRHGFKSLIAVPLVGASKPSGILCAYYRDVCLFDKGTVDRLMTVGRMVGAATESGQALGGRIPESLGGNERIADDFLRDLTTQTMSRANIYEALLKSTVKALSPAGAICGPLRLTSEALVLTIAEGAGIPPTAVGQRFSLPPALAQHLVLDKQGQPMPTLQAGAWGSLEPLIGSKSSSVLCQPVVWQKQPHALVLAWRSDRKPFTSDDEMLITRLTGITALALRAAA